jgi:hypothetical protein
VDTTQPAGDNHVVDAGVRHFGNGRVGFYQLQVIEQRAAPLLRLASSAIRLDYLLKRVHFGRQLAP